MKHPQKRRVAHFITYSLVNQHSCGKIPILFKNIQEPLFMAMLSRYVQVPEATSHYQRLIHTHYPLVICDIAIENGPVEIVNFPSYKMVDLSIVM